MTGTSRSGWLAWLRSIPRASVLVFCSVLLAAVQAVMALLEAPPWTRVTAAVLIALVAVASELDKLHTRRQEKADADRKRAAAAAAEAKWLRGARDSLRIWPTPSMRDVDPYDLGVVRTERPPNGHPPTHPRRPT